MFQPLIVNSVHIYEKPTFKKIILVKAIIVDKYYICMD